MENNDYINSDDARKDEITYDEGWQSVEFTEYPHHPPQSDGSVNTEPDNSGDDVSEKKENSHGRLVLTLRLTVCILIALAAFALKAIGGDVYSSVRSLYYDNLNDSAIFDGDSGMKLSQLFGATSDEAENS